MQDKRESLIKPNSSLAKSENVSDQYFLLKKENEKLQLENSGLKKNTEREELYYKNLYKQWKELDANIHAKSMELEQMKSNHNPKQKIYNYAFYGLVFIAVILLAFNFNSWRARLYNKPDSIKINSSNNETAFKSVSYVPSPAQKAGAGSANIPVDKNNINLNETKILPADSKVNSNPEAKKKDSNTSPQNPAKYVVKTKSYFHNKPDINTRRSTYVLPWNDAYGILTATDDINGFVYVVFTNRAGRTSKGWILKSDLEPLR